LVEIVPQDSIGIAAHVWPNPLRFAISDGPIVAADIVIARGFGHGVRLNIGQSVDDGGAPTRRADGNEFNSPEQKADSDQGAKWGDGRVEQTSEQKTATNEKRVGISQYRT